MKSTEELMNSADGAAEAWMAAVALFTQEQPDGFYRLGTGGTSEVVTGVPMPFFNGVFSTARHPHTEEVADFASSPRLKAVPWSITVRGERQAAGIEGTASEHRLGQRTVLPFMIRDLTWDAAGGARRPQPDALRVRRVAGDEAGLYRTTMAAGFECPEEDFTAFTSPSLLNHAAMRGYVAELDGEPVATSFGVFVGDHVGVFNIAVPPEHRRSGYAWAATTAVLDDARAAGARAAFLHATPPGVPLYQALGFRLAETWTVFVGE